MEIKLKKQIEKLEKEIRFKSVDLDEDIKDFSIDIHDYKSDNKLITISPRCIRCNLCAEECPVNAIQSATWFREAKIEDSCVNCEICAQTCPISAIYVLETETSIETDDVDESKVKYYLKDIPVRHRILKMKDIYVEHKNCVGCGSCTQFCPTKAITLENESFILEQGELETLDYNPIDTIDFNTDSNYITINDNNLYETLTFSFNSCSIMSIFLSLSIRSSIIWTLLVTLTSSKNICLSIMFCKPF